MLVTRLTNIFQVTTAPTDLTKAIPHTGGWSESLWTTLNPTAANAPWTLWQRCRALLLPQQAAIVGFRSQVYNIIGNKLFPGGAQSGKQNTPGRPGQITDLPQVALEVGIQGSGVINTSKQRLLCIPDAMMIGGEYQPTPTFSAAVTLYRNSIVGTNFGFIGRDLTQPAGRVLALLAGVLTVDAAIPGVAVGDFLRLNRVYNTLNQPVTGAYRVTAVAGANYTISPTPPDTVSKPSGTCRKDLLSYFSIGDMTPSRAVIRKVGRPLQGYRGRRSKVRR